MWLALRAGRLGQRDVAKGNCSKPLVKLVHRSGQPFGGFDFILSVVLASAAGAFAQDSAHVFGSPEVWHWAPSRTYHVENYKLKLGFDEPKGEVFGDEVVTLRPIEGPFRKFDALLQCLPEENHG